MSVLVVLPAAQLAIFGSTALARMLRLRLLLVDRRYRTVTAEAVSAAVLWAVEPSGVRQVTVRMGPVGGFARCFRAGDRAVVLLHERLPRRPDAARFIVAHEAAHIARYDHFRRPAVVMTIIVCWFAVAAFGWPVAIAGAVVALAVVVVLNRAMELDCDRLAVRWAGLAAAEQALSLVETARRLAPPSRFRAAWSRLAHPSTDRRRAAHL